MVIKGRNNWRELNGLRLKPYSSSRESIPINHYLEEMAKQLYDYWFVQFDFPDENGRPYKSSGGKMVWNDKLKREIPDGWQVKNIGSFANVKRGSTITKAQTVEGDIKVVAAATDYSFKHNEANRSAYVISVSSSGANAGFINFWREPIYASDCSTIQSEDITWTLYCYYWLLHFQDLLYNLQIGAAQPHVYPEHIENIPIVVPPQQLFEIIKDYLVNSNKHIEELGKENENLTKQRDELLSLLMTGQVSVMLLNNDLSEYHLPDSSILKEKTAMKDSIINTVISEMSHVLNPAQLSRLQEVMASTLVRYQIAPAPDQLEEAKKDNLQILEAFLSSKRVEGCSEKTEKYYRSTILQFLSASTIPIQGITTDDLRQYLSDCQSKRGLSKVTIDNMRRIFSSFFSWLEDEDYIIKSPVRRIHRVRTDSLIKETISDEALEILRDNCDEIRDLALIDMLSSTGVRVGELVQLNRSDINLQERQCVVFGKGNKEREVYFSARAKIHLQSYLDSRADDNPALFVSLKEPFNRLSISGVEVRLRTLGKRVQQQKIHPHKFRRTLATFAIDKGMPIEQVQKLLGHVKIDTTMHYAMVNQTNVKMAHRKFLG